MPRKGTTILIVDDSQTVLRFTSAVLKRAGYQVLVSDTLWVSREVSEHRPRLILMDVEMGTSLDGTAVAALRQRAFAADTKIVLYSSLSPATLQQLVEDCGADGFVPKSADSGLLLDKIQAILDDEDDGRESPGPPPVYHRPAAAMLHA